MATNKPNILVIFGDDIGVPQVSAYTRGLMGYQTRNIDRIAKTTHVSEWMINFNLPPRIYKLTNPTNTGWWIVHLTRKRGQN